MIYIVLFVLGLCLGSFVNALVWRLHQQSLPKKKRAANNAELSVVTGRSMCTHCHHILAWYDLLPLVSWLSLGGKCRYCRRPIGVQYPLVELVSGLVFIVSYHFWPLSFNGAGKVVFVVWLLELIVLMSLLVYDVKWMLLPDRLVLIGVIGALLIMLLRLCVVRDISGMFPVWGVICIAGLFYVLFQASGGKWIGGGDVKLGVALGLLTGGPFAAFMVIFFASLGGSIIGIPMLLRSKKRFQTKLPFGPLLIIATIFIFLFGSSLARWYRLQFLAF